MTIAFIHDHKAFLPEIEAYRHYFSSFNVKCIEVSKQQLKQIPHDVEWFFMGTDHTPASGKIIKIHEYGSASTGNLKSWKNSAKRIMNTRPHFRLFLNEYVKKAFSFHDDVPYGFRDMGIPAHWAPDSGEESVKEFDFIYIGSLAPEREPRKLLNHFAEGALKTQILLLLSNEYELLQKKYSNYPNIIFKGPVQHNMIGSYLKKARFGINYIIDKAPFNQQTSTKFLEYAACGLPVISTRYGWIEKFRTQYGGAYFYTDNDLSNFNWENVTSFNYKNPDLHEWSWEQQIRKSGITDFLHLNLTDPGSE